MRDRRRESGRFVIVVAVLVALSAGAVYVKRVIDAPQAAFERAVEERGARRFLAAANSFREAMELGHPGAAFELAALHKDGKGVERSFSKVFELYGYGADAGHGPSQLELARMYRHGRGTAPDLEQAVSWYWTAARNGLPEAQLELGHLFRDGEGMQADPAEAVRWYSAAAGAGLGEAQLELGIAYAEGSGVEKDLSQAAMWLQRAAEDANLAEAWVRVGEFHEHGEAGFERDLEQAAWCYERAAEERHPEALYRLGMMKLEGRGLPRDASGGVGHLSFAADAGHADAMYQLALAYERGDGVRQSRHEAREWYERAAAAGHIGSSTELKLMGLRGEEPSRSERRRLERLRKEALEKEKGRQARSLAKVGRCEVYGPSGPIVELRTRMDCLNRGGAFTESDRDAMGSFSTVDPERDWDDQRRELNRRAAAERRKSRQSGYRTGPAAQESLETDWVACYSRASRNSAGRASYSCMSPMRKRREMTTSWCRDRGYDSRRLFKHESSARSWYSENCW